MSSFLAEAFTRPKNMDQLAKEGFTQGYSYFTWRFSKQELTEYMEQLTKGPQKEFYRPNFWPNTPDINPYHLQGANESPTPDSLFFSGHSQLQCRYLWTCFLK